MRTSHNNCSSDFQVESQNIILFLPLLTARVEVFLQGHLPMHALVWRRHCRSSEPTINDTQTSTSMFLLQGHDSLCVLPLLLHMTEADFFSLGEEVLSVKSGHV